MKIGLYEINKLKVADAEGKEIVRFEFGTQDFNPYDPHGICKDHCTIVYFSWLSRAFHFPKEDPWRYCYNASRLYDLVSLAGTSQVAPQMTMTS